MNFQHIRHATHRITYADKTILIDPVFSQEGTMTPIPNIPNQCFNPLTKLPLPAEILCKSHMVIVTHMHRDHFDDAAGALLPKTMPVICAPHDAPALAAKGFENYLPVEDTLCIEGIEITITGGTHGTGKTAPALNPVAGYVLKADVEPTLYITGDTVWCPEMQDVLRIHQPEIIICYGGAARYEGDTITMGIHDFENILETCPSSTLIIIHTEGWNHCVLSRAEVNKWAAATGEARRVLVPEDGQTLPSFYGR